MLIFVARLRLGATYVTSDLAGKKQSADYGQGAGGRASSGTADLSPLLKRL
jgi:hypothetical protein